MPFKPIDFSDIAPQGFQSFSRGLATGMSPFQELRNQKSQSLTDALKKISLEYLPKQYQSNIAFTQAQQNRVNQDVRKQQLINDFLSKGQSPYGVVPHDFAKILARKAAGFPIQTPEEKYSQELQTYADKQRIKAQQEKKNIGTLSRGSRTILQTRVQALNDILPMLSKLKNIVPGKLDYTPSGIQKKILWKNYQSNILERIQKAINSGVNIPALKKLESMLDRSDLETNNTYLSQIDTLGKTLNGELNNANNILNSGTVTANPEALSSFANNGDNTIRTTFKNKQDFANYMESLSSEQKKRVIANLEQGG